MKPTRYRTSLIDRHYDSQKTYAAVSRKYDEEIEEHADTGNLKYKHFLLDFRDAIFPSLGGEEFVSYQHIKENFTIGNFATISIRKPQLIPESKQTRRPKDTDSTLRIIKADTIQRVLL